MNLSNSLLLMKSLLSLTPTFGISSTPTPFAVVLSRAIMKISSNQFIIYRICLGMENTKYQEAVLVAKTYLLKKINSMAYQLHLEDIQNILD